MKNRHKTPYYVLKWRENDSKLFLRAFAIVSGLITRFPPPKWGVFMKFSYISRKSLKGNYTYAKQIILISRQCKKFDEKNI